MKIRKTCILLAALFLGAACTPNKTKTSESGTDSCETVKPDTLTFDTLSLRVQKNLIEGKEFPNYTIELRMPFAKGESPLAQTINSAICQKFLHADTLAPKAALQYYTDSLAQQFTSDINEFFDPQETENVESFQYSWLSSGEITPNHRPGIITYSLYQETYQGGAHGGHDVFCLNLDEKTGRRLTKSDIFWPETEPQLLEAILQKLVEDNGCLTSEELMEKTGITMLGEVYLGENFLLEKDGITFVYNTYEIAPYAAGTIFVFLPYDQLDNYLIPYSSQQ